MLWGVDSAYPHGWPQALADAGFSFACGYIGGQAEHVWTGDDWRGHAAAGLGLVPIWVAPSGEPSRDDGVTAGNGALAAMQDLGLSGQLVLDIEDGAVPVDYAAGFIAACYAGQASVAVYGSSRTLRELDGFAAWWLAAWVAPSAPLGPALPDWSMWQYATGPRFDYDVARDDFMFATLNGPA